MHHRFGRQRGKEGIIIERQYPWSFKRFDLESKDSKEVKAGKAEHNFDWDSIRWWGDCVTVATAALEAGDHISTGQLQSPPGLPSVPMLRWVFSGDPLYGAQSFHFTASWSAISEREATVRQAILELAKNLESIEENAFRVAVRRIRSALFQPKSADESFVDALIAWEALSGKCDSGPKIMVTSVMAALTSADKKSRKSVRECLGKVYQTRNSIVHGGASVPWDEIGKHRDFAVVTALVAIKSLLRNHHDLLGRSDRFQQLFLD